MRRPFALALAFGLIVSPLAAITTTAFGAVATAQTHPARVAASGLRQSSAVTSRLARPAAASFGVGVANVRVLDAYKYSVVLRWDAAPGTYPDSYVVDWGVTGAAPTGHAYAAGVIQLQPLKPSTVYTARITPLFADPATGAPIAGTPYQVDNISPKGTYEASLAALTHSGGFLYLPEQDTPMIRPNPAAIHIYNDGMNVWPANTGDHPEKFGHSSVALNDQQHWHIVAGDLGSGSITARVQAPVNLSGNFSRHIRFDSDLGPIGRQAWYIVLTPYLTDSIRLLPNNGDDHPATSAFPEITVRFGGNTADVRYFVDGALVRSESFDARGASYPNVRQLMGLDLDKNGITFLADGGYDGHLQAMHTFAADLSNWATADGTHQSYLYFTLGSYNNPKLNEVFGVNGYGRTVQQYALGLWHLGNIAFDGPTPQGPPAEAPAGSWSIPSDQLFNTMPEHSELANWVIPTTTLSYAGPVVHGQLPVTLAADTGLSAVIAGGYVPLKRVALLLDDQEVWSQDLIANGYGVLSFRTSFNLDTTRYPDGYHTLRILALTTAGTQGSNNDDNLYNYNASRQMLIHNAASQGRAPSFTAFTFADQATGATTQITEGSVVPVKRGGAYYFNFSLATAAPLASVTVTVNGNLWTSYSPGLMPQHQANGETVYDFNGWGGTIYDWWPFNSAGVLPFAIVATDADGNMVQRHFSYQLPQSGTVTSTPTVTATGTATTTVTQTPTPGTQTPTFTPSPTNTPGPSPLDLSVSEQPPTPQPGGRMVVRVVVRASRGSLSDGGVLIKVYNADWSGVVQQYDFEHVNILRGSTASFGWHPTAPQKLGIYRIDVGVYGPGRTPQYNEDTSVQFSVVPHPVQ